VGEKCAILFAVAPGNTMGYILAVHVPIAGMSLLPVLSGWSGQSMSCSWNW
jgi:hypothetical protein